MISQNGKLFLNNVRVKRVSISKQLTFITTWDHLSAIAAATNPQNHPIFVCAVPDSSLKMLRKKRRRRTAAVVDKDKKKKANEKENSEEPGADFLGGGDDNAGGDDKTLHLHQSLKQELAQLQEKLSFQACETQSLTKQRGDDDSRNQLLLVMKAEFQKERDVMETTLRELQHEREKLLLDLNHEAVAELKQQQTIEKHQQQLEIEALQNKLAAQIDRSEKEKRDLQQQHQQQIERVSKEKEEELKNREAQFTCRETELLLKKEQTMILEQHAAQLNQEKARHDSETNQFTVLLEELKTENLTLKQKIETLETKIRPTKSTSASRKKRKTKGRDVSDALTAKTTLPVSEFQVII